MQIIISGLRLHDALQSGGQIRADRAGGVCRNQHIDSLGPDGRTRITLKNLTQGIARLAVVTKAPQALECFQAYRGVFIVPDAVQQGVANVRPVMPI